MITADGTSHCKRNRVLKKLHACLQVYVESTVLERNKENESVIDTAGQLASHTRSKEM
jgi:hypothetical protein